MPQIQKETSQYKNDTCSYQKEILHRKNVISLCKNFSTRITQITHKFFAERGIDTNSYSIKERGFYGSLREARIGADICRLGKYMEG